MFRFVDASLRFAHRELFRALNWQVGGTDRVGLVGSNGSGKTTLLRILAGVQELDKGTLLQARGASLGYLPQEGIVHAGQTVFAEARSVFEPVLELKRKQESLLHSLEHLSPSDEAFTPTLEEAQRLEDRYRHLGGYTIDQDVGLVLRGLGFEKDDWDRPTETFSGGWQMRLALARLLLQKPDLLLLDEPTNHLDLEAREWLAAFLRAYPNAVVLVAHDRFFMDQVVNRISEIEQATIVDYPGNYSAYLKEKEARREAQLMAWKRQQEELGRLESFVERFRYKATKASQVQSRLKAMEKMDLIEAPLDSQRVLKLNLPEPPRSGDTALELVGVEKRYGSKEVFRSAELTVRRGDKIALVGPNGAGKSTLMRILSGFEPPDAGERRLGYQVIPRYFAQDQGLQLVWGRTIIEELGAAAPNLGEGHLRGVLGSFLFSGEDVFKKVDVLSGGEKNRLALAKLLMSPCNLLLLDEPTNHLDLTSKEVLLEALRDYTGTVIFVSHDRHFIEELATRTVEAGGGGLYDYPGSYRDYLSHKARQADEAARALEAAKGRTAAVSEPVVVKENVAAYKEWKKNTRQVTKARERVAKVMELIEAKEAEVGRLEEEMHDPAISAHYAKLLELEQRRAALTDEVASLYEEWETLSAQLESVS